MQDFLVMNCSSLLLQSNTYTLQNIRKYIIQEEGKEIFLYNFNFV